MRENFGTARLVIQVLEIAGWLTVLGAVMVMYMLAQDRDGFTLADAGVGLALALAGIVQVAAAQVTRAVVVTAENSGEMVALLRAQADAATAGRGRDAPAPAVRAAPAGSAASAMPDVAAHAGGSGVGSVVKRYKGRPIVREPNGVSVDGEGLFPDVMAAERFIDGR